MLAQIEQAAPREERDLIQRIRATQDDALTSVADIANLLRDGKHGEAMTLHLASGYPLYERIEGLVSKPGQDRRRQDGELAGERRPGGESSRHSGIIGEHVIIDARTLPAVRMPNRDGFVPDPRPDVGKLAKPAKR